MTYTSSGSAAPAAPPGSGLGAHCPTAGPEAATATAASAAASAAALAAPAPLTPEAPRALEALAAQVAIAAEGVPMSVDASDVLQLSFRRPGYGVAAQSILCRVARQARPSRRRAERRYSARRPEGGGYGLSGRGGCLRAPAARGSRPGHAKLSW
eukprot:14348070-Alexandrium_andersonii.AAC.1